MIRMIRRRPLWSGYSSWTAISKICLRSLSSESSSTSTNQAFDRTFKRLQRDQAARLFQHRMRLPGAVDHIHNDDNAIDYDYFRDEIARRLVDRLDDIKVGFPLALDLGAGTGSVHRMICSESSFDGIGGIGGVRKLVQLDSSDLMLHRDDERPVKGLERCGTYKMEIGRAHV